MARDIVATLALQAVAVVCAMLLDALGFSEATMVIVFVLGVLLTALFTTSAVYCLAAAGLSIMCFNFFLVEPRFSFRIQGADVPGTIVVMFVVACVASYLVTQQRSSERASAEAQLLAQNEQLRANLLRSVSHDLRTPLTAISGNADMLLDQSAVLDEAQRETLLRDIRDDAMWLTGVVENLLSITRLEDGRVALDSDVELVDDVVEEALQHVSGDVCYHQLSYMPSQELLLARMDTRVMVQVVVNLVNNAIQHSGCGSHIVVEVSRKGDFALVSVADDGPGVRDEDKARVFESFYTAGGTSTDGRRGIGLGLPLCRTVVEAHGGKLELRDAVPHGAVFSFTLPLEEVASDE
ncbi:MAG: DUF4118 domain-containing protein [Atopobiaceae bacterium]|nr:DUF4118 domain-containing protein [Atopobiaceae bacterium]